MTLKRQNIAINPLIAKVEQKAQQERTIKIEGCECSCCIKNETHPRMGPTALI